MSEPEKEKRPGQARGNAKLQWDFFYVAGEKCASQKNLPVLTRRRRETLKIKLVG